MFLKAIECFKNFLLIFYKLYFLEHRRSTLLLNQLFLFKKTSLLLNIAQNLFYFNLRKISKENKFLLNQKTDNLSVFFWSLFY